MMEVLRYLFGILNGASLWIPVSEKDQFLLLSSPQSSDALAIEFDDPEADMPPVEHNDLVFIRPFLDDMSES